MEHMRIFAGGLPRDVQEKELRDRFSKFGNVGDLEIRKKTDATGEWWKTFGHINMEITQQEFRKCKSQLNNTTWRDGKITIQLAKQSPCDIYANERKQMTLASSGPEKPQIIKAEIPDIVKGAVPGTLLPDHEDWVVTKFQRVVPVMKVRSKDKKRVITYDPSRYSHQLKRLDKNDADLTTAVGNLTWALTEDANEGGDDSNYRKRVGDFTGIDSGSKKKMKQGRSAAEIIAQRAAERANAVDDMEVVPVYEHSQDEKSLDDTKLTSSLNNGIDLSRFDSDSDSEAEPPLTNGFTSTPNQPSSTIKSNKMKPMKISTTKANVVKSSRTAKSSSIISKSRDDIPYKSDKITIESIDGDSGHVSSEDSTSDSSYTSSSDLKCDIPVKTKQRRSFPGTASFSESYKSPTKSSDSVITANKEDSVTCKNSGEAGVHSNPIDNGGQVSTSGACDSKSRDVLEGCDKIEVTTPKQPLSSLASIFQAITSTTPGQNCDSLPSNLAQLLPTSFVGNENTPPCVTPDSLAFLLESAASILRSAATANRNSQKPQDDGLIHHAPLPNFNITDSGSSPEHSTSSQKRKIVKSDHKTALESQTGHQNIKDMVQPIAPDSVQKSDVENQESSSSDSSTSDTDNEVPENRQKLTNKQADSGESSCDSTSDSSESESEVETKSSKTGTKNSISNKKEFQEASTSSTSSCSDSSDGELRMKLTSGQTIASHQKKVDTSSSSTATTSSSEDSESDEESSVTPLSSLGVKNVNIDVVMNPANQSTTSSNDCSETQVEHTKKLPKKPKIKSTVTKQAFMTVAEKRDLSNKKRLEALTSKKNAMKSQQQAVQSAISSMDKGSNTKRIVFDSDSDGEGESLSVKKQSKNVKCNVTGGSKKILFDDSDEDESEEVYDKMFAVKAQFEGEKGAKLLNLQKAFNDDSRFKLTEKFLEVSSGSSTEDEKDDKQAEETNMPEQSGLEERRKNLEILQSIVGSRSVKLDHPTIAKTKSKKFADTPSSVFRDISSMQFDPTDQSHDHLLKAVTPAQPKAKKKSKKEGSEPVVGSEPAPQVSSERFFEVDINFGKTKSENKAGGMTFGFLPKEDGDTSQPSVSGSAMKFNFLGDQSDNDSEEDDGVVGSAVAGKGILSEKYKNPFAEEKKFSDESEEDEESDDDTAQSGTTKDLHISTTRDTPTKNTVVDWFFFKPDDPRLIDGATRFSKTLDDDVLRKKWEEIRPKLVENYLMKSKRAVRKLTTNRTSVIKKRFTPRRNEKSNAASAAKVHN